MTSVRSSKIMAALLAVMLMLTLLSTTVFATDSEPVAAPADTTAGAASSAADPDDSAAPSDTGASGSDKKDEDNSINWDLIISLSIIGLAVVLFVIFYFANNKFHDRVNKFCREYKSELGKVVWSPARDVKQNTLVVIVIVAATALIIGVLDFVFSKGIISLGSLF